MVCKEDVLSWFKDLESYKRIDVMYELLNMCLPFELRFIGSCIEEIGKHTYQELRGSAINANEMEKLTKDLNLNQGLLDDSVRHRVLIYLSLLSSRNYSVANWLYKNLLRTEWIEDYILKGNIKDEHLHNEYLLLFVMALHHPAFTFEQKLFFGKILTHLLDLKENRNRISPKPSVYGYPPGFGYPTIKTMTIPEVPSISTKSSIPPPPPPPIAPPHLDETILHQQPPPCGLPHIPPPTSQDFLPWNRPPFTCGAPDVPPFPPPPPPPTVSSIVSQSTPSPIHSRSGSPHRNMSQSSLRQAVATTMPPPPPQQPLIEAIPIATQLSVDPATITNAGNFSFLYPPENVKLDDDLNPMVDERIIMENPWSLAGIATKETTKQMNGIRFGLINSGNGGNIPSKGLPLGRPFLIEQQLQSLNFNDSCSIDNCSLQRSNSSSCSSLNRTPPDTPVPTTTTTIGVVAGSSTIPRGIITATTTTTTDKVRVNGLIAPVPTQQQQFGANNSGGPPPPGLPLGDTTSSPPPPLPPPTFNNVPYTTYPTPFTAIPSRTIFQQYTTTNQSYRPPFQTTTPPHFPPPNYHQTTNDNSYPTYTIQPYMSIIYSSPQFQTRNPNCYNCGAMGHYGQDCNGQNIEEITQKKTFMLDFQTSHLPDAEK